LIEKMQRSYFFLAKKPRWQLFMEMSANGYQDF